MPPQMGPNEINLEAQNPFEFRRQLGSFGALLA